MTNGNAVGGAKSANAVGRLGLAVLGLGAVSRFYLAALPSSDWRLRAVCDLDEGRLRSVRDHHVFKTTEFEAVLGREDVDAVVVNLPNAHHFEACRAALTAGKHVCCEKPLTLNLEDAAALQSIALREGRVLFTAFHRRYNRHVAELAASMKTAVSATVEYRERIEDHCGADSWYLDPAACGGGCVADNGPNAFDTLRFLLGPLEVESAVLARNERQIDVRAEIDLRSAGGASAHVSLDWAYPGERKTIEVVDSSGGIHRADMLESYPGFKQSLFHEYRGVLAAFAENVRQSDPDDAGLEIVRLVADAYRVAEAGPRPRRAAA